MCVCVYSKLDSNSETHQMSITILIQFTCFILCVVLKNSDSVIPEAIKLVSYKRQPLGMIYTKVCELHETI